MEPVLTTDIHEIFMSRALELARQGRGNVSPNPLVGCVLVKEGEIIGEGYHEEFGGAHAEVNALRNSRQDPVDATAYINLEPCCFMGKTPPCTDTLIQNGIAEVYIGMLDPNPEVNGKGVEALKKANIIVHVGVGEEDAWNLNRPFEKWITTKIPFVTAKAAQTPAGFMGVDSDHSVWLTGEVSGRHTHQLRAESDAILIGRQTAVIDDPALTVRHVPGENPTRVILDTNRTLPLTLNMFHDRKAKNIVFCSENRFDRNKTHFCDYIPVPEAENGLSIPHIVRKLGEKNVTSLLVEGGQEVLQSFLDADCIDRMVIYTAANELEKAELKNPLIIPENWVITIEDFLGEDRVIIAEKGVECLQEL
ncbi:MAG: bifunctional diaminohydroxyphosphoribosylaminopyrimidine deaminase/5-amino-6-(5-phosphoribosylamino)uracil reductase RibD [Candidatus Marinimicrobia bacterium]|nr:bifunctional diaminohydroxyphosphoribosylaminopyrimidine deaminase/5-amino-6-(5-phosphoribosylamino)uracil reductase RibD [Candidatus Neomarinimicrobiota bacterium]